MNYFSNLYDVFVYLFQMDTPLNERDLEAGLCSGALDVTNVTNVITAAATLIIAFFTICTVWVQIIQHRHQRQVANANYQHSLHKDRLLVYYAFNDFYDHLMANGNPERLAVHDFMSKVRDAKFLFDEDVLGTIDELVDYAGQYFSLERRIDILRRKARNRDFTDLENKQWEDLFQQLGDLESGIRDEFLGNKLDDLFEGYLKLPKSL